MASAIHSQEIIEYLSPKLAVLFAFISILASILGLASIMSVLNALSENSLLVPNPLGGFLMLFMFLFYFSLPFTSTSIVSIPFNRLSRKTFVSLAINSRRICLYILYAFFAIFFVGLFLSIFATMIGIHLVILSMGLILMIIPFFLSFDGCVSIENLNRISFLLLLDSLTDYKERQYHLCEFAKKIELKLNMASIKAPPTVFLRYFNLQLIQGKKIDAELTELYEWVKDDKSGCYDTIKKVYGEEKLKAFSRRSIFNKIFGNSTLRAIFIRIMTVIGTFIIWALIIWLFVPQAFNELLQNIPSI